MTAETDLQTDGASLTWHHPPVVSEQTPKDPFSPRWQCLNLGYFSLVSSSWKEVGMHRPSVNTAEKERGARNSRSLEEMHTNNNKCSSGYCAG